jgi:hypothetical protein
VSRRNWSACDFTLTVRPEDEIGTADFVPQVVAQRDEAGYLCVRRRAAAGLPPPDEPLDLEGPLPAELPPLLGRALSLVRVDLTPAHPQPSAVRVAIATAVSVAGSLAADAILVVIGAAVFPSTKGYGHFQFSDYAKLTVIGVLIACVAWPVVTRISSAPRWLFFRMAIVVTLVLWLPDLYILHGGAPPRAVAVLMVMHLAIALVTYNCLVHIAAVGPEGAASRPQPAAHHHARPGN